MTTTQTQVRSTEEALKLALVALDDRTSLMKWQIARDAVKEALMSFQDGAQPAVAEQHKQEPDLGGVGVFYPTEQEPVAIMREMLEVQGQHGNWNYDSYMHGLYNGMEYMVALAEKREPKFRDAPDEWLAKYEVKRDNFNSTEPLTEAAPPYVATPRQRTAAEGEDTQRAWVHATEWRGLTDEEMQDLWDRYAHMEMMRAIETKLKAKNERKEKNTRNGGCL